MSFISISIDIGNSTKSKSSIKNHAKNTGLSSIEHYASFQQKMFEIEHSFLDLVLNSPLNINRLHLLKIIGDELWYSYKMNGLNKNERHQSITTIIHLLAHMNTLLFTFQYKNSPVIQMPIKITLDTLSDVLEISSMRNQYQSSKLKKLLHPTTPIDDESSFSELYKQLTQSHNHEADHPDYIGYEVDRFFRLTRQVKNNMMLLGPNIMNLFKENAFSTVRLESFTDSAEFLLTTKGLEPRALVFSKKVIPANSMKGIDTPCCVGIIQTKVTTCILPTPNQPTQNLQAQTL